MKYLQNHVWCSRSNWDGDIYHCRHLVSWKEYEEADRDDWNNLVHHDETYLDPKIVERLKSEMQSIKPDVSILTYGQNVQNLKPHVLAWLEENVKDRKDEGNNKGWCIGDTEYRATDTYSMSVFFHRKPDAMAFIKTFSIYKKPTHYCQYFTNVRKKLNLNTMKYETL